MSTSLKHATDEELCDYSREPERVSFFALRSHLICCPQCQQRLDSIQNAEQWLVVNSALHQTTESTDSTGQANERDALKASLHNIAHRSAMLLAEKEAKRIAQNDSYNVQTSKLKPIQPAPLFIQKLKEFFSLKGFIWISVPVTALATIVLAVFLLPQILPFSHTNLNVIAVYQDDPVVTFTDEQATTGIGFFNASKQITAQYNGIKIVANTEDAIQLEWPPVVDAEYYVIRLFKVQTLPQQDMVSLKTSDNVAQFDRLALTPGRRYGWELSGATHDGRFFKSKGGFVVSKQ
jgi:hypothetical protein